MSRMNSNTTNKAFTASAQTLPMDVSTLGICSIDVRGTFSATLVVEGTVNGTDWFTLNITPINGGTAVSSITAAGQWAATTAALSKIRVRCSAYTSGTATVVLLATDLTNPVELSGITLEVNLDNANDDVLVYGFDGTSNQKIKTDTSGELQIDVLSSALPTGASTAANQTTIIGHVDGIEALLTTIDADTGNIDTSLNNIETFTTDLPNVIGTDGSAGPSKAVSIGGTQSTGELQEIQVDSDGQLQIDVISSALPTGAATEATSASIKTAVELIDNAVSGAGFNITQFGGAAVPIGAGLEATAIRVTLPTDGTGKVNAAQSGTWNITNISGTISLPTGAATETTLADIKTAAQLIDDTVFVDDAAWTDNTSKHLLVGGLYQSTQQTITDGRVAPIALDANGNVRVNIMAGAAAGGTSMIDDAAFTVGTTAFNPVGGTYKSVRDSVNDNDGGAFAMTATRALYSTIETPNGDSAMDDTNDAVKTTVVTALPAGTNAIGKLAANSGVDIGDVDITSIIPGTGATNLGKAIDTATGATDTGVLILATRDDALGALTPAEGDNVQLRTDANGALWTHDDALDACIGGSELQVDVVGSLPAGTNAIGKLAANSGVDIGDVDVTSISAGSNLIGDVGISGARTTGGTTIYRTLDLDETEEEVKGTAGQIYWIHAINLSTGVRYLKVYNDTAANVSVGTTTPVLTFPIPTLATTNGNGFVFAVPNGIKLTTAITIAATTGLADADTGAPGANDVVVNLGYA